MEPSGESTVKSSGADLILVAAVLSSQLWYPKLLGLLVTNPLIIDPQEEIVIK